MGKLLKFERPNNTTISVDPQVIKTQLQEDISQRTGEEVTIEQLDEALILAKGIKGSFSPEEIERIRLELEN